jgi:hypothetical protein
VEAGVRYDNPARFIKRMSERAKKAQLLEIKQDANRDKLTQRLPSLIVVFIFHSQTELIVAAQATLLVQVFTAVQPLDDFGGL